MQSSSSPKKICLAVPALSPYTRQGFSHAKLTPRSCMHFTHCSQDTDLAHNIVALKPTRNKNQSQNLLLRRQRALSIMKLVLETPRLLTSEHKEQSPHPKYLPSGSTTREFIAGGGFSMNTPGEEHVYKQITPAIFSRSVSGMLFICLFIYSTRK